jgi:hypothetical protein
LKRERERVSYKAVVVTRQRQAAAAAATAAEVAEAAEAAAAAAAERLWRWCAPQRRRPPLRQKLVLLHIQQWPHSTSTSKAMTPPRQRVSLPSRPQSSL